MLPLPFSRHPNPIIEEPKENVYGPFRVLRRVDNRFVVHDTRQTWPFTFGKTYRVEWAARAAAEHFAKQLDDAKPNEMLSALNEANP